MSSEQLEPSTQRAFLSPRAATPLRADGNSEGKGDLGRETLGFLLGHLRRCLPLSQRCAEVPQAAPHPVPAALRRGTCAHTHSAEQSRLGAAFAALSLLHNAVLQAAPARLSLRGRSLPPPGSRLPAPAPRVRSVPGTSGGCRPFAAPSPAPSVAALRRRGSSREQPPPGKRSSSSHLRSASWRLTSKPGSKPTWRRIRSVLSSR